MKKYIIIPAVCAMAISAISCQKELTDVSGSSSLSISVSMTDDGSAPVVKSRGQASGETALFDIEITESPIHFSAQETKGTPVEDAASFVDAVPEFYMWGFGKTNGTNGVFANWKKRKVVRYDGVKYCPVDDSGNQVNLFPLFMNGERQVTSFAALASLAPEASITSLAYSSGALSFYYTVPAPDTEQKCDAMAQKEILLGTLNGTPTDSNIPLTFKHPLATVKFVIGEIKRDITIDYISISATKSVGMCTLSSDGAISWSDVKTGKTYTQTFDFSATTSTTPGTSIDDGTLSRTFIMIPQKLTSSSIITIGYTDEAGPHTATYPLEANTWEAGKEYTYKINSYSSKDVWVDYAATTRKAGGDLSQSHIVVNESMSVVYPQIQGNYEKLLIPIRNLVVGQWYELTFMERLSRPSGKPINNNGVGAYACRVSNRTVDGGYTTMLTYYDGSSDANTGTTYVWSAFNGKTYSDATYPDNPVKILFKAEDETVTWQWDYSKVEDGANDIVMEIYNGQIIKVMSPEGPAVDFLNSNHIGFLHRSPGEEGGGKSGNSTYKTYATYNSLEFHAYPQANKYERLNVPLINLIPGHTYTLSYTFERTAGETAKDTKNYIGHRIADAPSTDTGAYTPDESFVNLTSECSSSTFTITDSFEFTAESETMYWIWEFSALTNKKMNDFYFSNVQLTDITAD